MVELQYIQPTISPEALRNIRADQEKRCWGCGRTGECCCDPEECRCPEHYQLIDKRATEKPSAIQQLINQIRQEKD